MMPQLLVAQTGLPDVTGGFLVLALAGLLALGGLVLCALGLIYRKPPLFVLGLLLASPVLALVGYLLWPEIPRTRSWDFSVDRSVARLDQEPVHGRYYYSGNIRSTIRLPGNRQWTGRASRVSFEAGSGEAGAGQVAAIYWDSQRLDTERAYLEARRILRELGLEQRGLDAWRQKAGGRDWENFRASTPPGAEPRIEFHTRRWPAGEPEAKEFRWYLQVEVVWPE